jgi:hypothetical protein
MILCDSYQKRKAKSPSLQSLCVPERERERDREREREREGQIEIKKENEERKWERERERYSVLTLACDHCLLAYDSQV